MTADLFSHARRQRDTGMVKALSSAESEAPAWPKDAYAFLVAYARQTLTFISEDVSAASKLDTTFTQPPTDRAWGHIYRKAVQNGVIVQDGSGRSTRRHASICPRWRSLIIGQAEVA